ncbi:MAG: hypothetical protein Q7U82_14105 [Gammaproteobacteria bacterium]|nr:hypothetical protein [Gammaproteobacteria bacterium]
MRKETRKIVVSSAAAMLLLTIGSLAAYSWTLGKEVAELRGGSAGAEREVLQKLEQSAEQQAQADRQALFDPWTGLVIGGDPFQRLQQMQQEMDRLFSGVAGNGTSLGFGGGLGGFGAATQPEIELQESDDEYRVIISIAKDSEVELVTELEDNTLSISAQVRSEVRHQSGNFGGGLQSTSISQFSRSIPLEEPVDATGLQTEKSPEEIVITIPKIG